MILNATPWRVQYHVDPSSTVPRVEYLPPLILQMEIQEDLVAHEIQKGSYDLQRCDHFSSRTKKLYDFRACKHVEGRHYFRTWTIIIVVISLFCCLFFESSTTTKYDLIVKFLLWLPNVILIL